MFLVDIYYYYLLLLLYYPTRELSIIQIKENYFKNFTDNIFTNNNLLTQNKLNRNIINYHVTIKKYIVLFVKYYLLEKNSLDLYNIDTVHYYYTNKN